LSKASEAILSIQSDNKMKFKYGIIQTQFTDKVLGKSQSLQALELLETVATDRMNFVFGHVELLQLHLFLKIWQIPQFIASQVDHFRIDSTRNFVGGEINQFNGIAGKQNE
jgi:hypothetical protein